MMANSSVYGIPTDHIKNKSHMSECAIEQFVAIGYLVEQWLPQRIHTAALEPTLRLVGRNTWEGIGKACALCETFYKVFNRGRA